MKGKQYQQGVADKNTRCLCIVEIRYVAAPDAGSRISRAVDILLGAAVRTLEGSINGKKEEELPKDSRPEKIAGQSDGERG